MTVIIRIQGPFQEVADSAAALRESRIFEEQVFVAEHWAEGNYVMAMSGRFDRKHAMELLEREAEP